MKTSRVLALALVLGVLATGLTGLINTTPEGLLGATHYGYPLAWLYQIVYIGMPIEVDWAMLLLDIAIWSVIIAIVLMLLQYALKR